MAQVKIEHVLVQGHLSCRVGELECWKYHCGHAVAGREEVRRVDAGRAARLATAGQLGGRQAISRWEGAGQDLDRGCVEQATVLHGRCEMRRCERRERRPRQI
eukprot:7384202-Prymnesium_polylepis.1